MVILTVFKKEKLHARVAAILINEKERYEVVPGFSQLRLVFMQIPVKLVWVTTVETVTQSVAQQHLAHTLG